MNAPRDLRELVGDDVSDEELAELARVDALLRSVPPPPPHVPESLTEAVLRHERRVVPLWTRGRLAGGLALAAAVALVFFGLGTRAGGDDFEPETTVELRATEHARGASAEIAIGDRDETGNFGMEIEVAGLRPLPKGGYYTLWLAKDGEYAATCGTFTVGKDGTADVYMSASYDLSKYDAFVVTAHLPDAPRDEEPDWLLTAPI